MSIFAAILALAVILAGLHMLAPDHWIPLTVVSSRLSFSHRRTYATAAFLGILHAGTSATLALIALFIGTVVAGRYENYLNYGAILLLVAVGLYFIVTGYSEHDAGNEISGASVSTVLSISIFPDLALMPIVLAGASLSPVDMGTVIIAFALASALSLTLVVYGAIRGFARGLEKIPPRYIDYIMGAILLATAAFVTLVDFL
jgi:hypothetical protein